MSGVIAIYIQIEYLRYIDTKQKYWWGIQNIIVAKPKGL